MAQAQEDLDPNDPLQLLTQELASQASMYTAEATERAPVAIQMADTLQTQAAVGGTTDRGGGGTGGVTVNDVLAQLSLTESGTVVGRVAKGQKTIAKSANVHEKIDPATGDTLLVLEPARAQNDYKVAAAVIDTQGQVASATFDINREVERMRTLTGNDLMDHVGKMLSNIEVRKAEEMKRIRQTAGIESGYLAARAALDRNVMLDQTSGFTQRHGFASAQTQAAQALVQQTLAAQNSLLQGLIAQDSKLAELHGVQQEIVKVQARQGARQARREDIQEEAAALVTPIELANYHMVYGKSGNDMQDKVTIAQRRDRDKVMGALIQATPENITTLLVNPDPKIRDGALKLVVEYDKARNPQYQGQDETPTSRLVKQALAAPEKTLFETIRDPDQKKQLLQQYRTATSGKERAEFRANHFPDLLARYVEQNLQNAFELDVRAWKAPNINDGSEFDKTIKEVSATSPTGRVPLGTAVEAFMARKIQTPDGKELGFPEKVAMLEQNLRGASNAIERNLMMSNDGVEAMRIRLTNKMKNVAARAYIRNTYGNVFQLPPFTSGLSVAHEWFARRQIEDIGQATPPKQ